MKFNEADFIDLTQAHANVDKVLQNLTTMEDWINMAKTLVVNGKRDDAMKVSKALVKKASILDRIMKLVPARKISTKITRRSKWI